MELQLPFKVHPVNEVCDIGDPQIGVLEIPKLGDLSPNERIKLQQYTSCYPDTRMAAVDLAKKIAADSELKVLEVYGALTTGDYEALGDHLGEFVNFQKLIEDSAALKRLALATVILQRLLPQWDMENTGDAKLIHPNLVQLIADFGSQEEVGWSQAIPSEITEDDLGNSSPQ